jgi:hypothetical protein
VALIISNGKVLRLSSRMLEAPSHEEPSQSTFSGGSLAPSKYERKWNEANEPSDDVQAGSISLKEMETLGVTQKDCIYHRRAFFQCWKFAGVNAT